MFGLSTQAEIFTLVGVLVSGGLSMTGVIFVAKIHASTKSPNGTRPGVMLEEVWRGQARIEQQQAHHEVRDDERFMKVYEHLGIESVKGNPAVQSQPS